MHRCRLMCSGPIGRELGFFVYLELCGLITSAVAIRTLSSHFDYYLNFLIFYGNTFSSLIVFIAVIWFTAKMSQDSEIIPMLFSGKPFTRILRPYMISATILMLLSLVLNQFVLPISNKTRFAFEEKYYQDRMLIENYHAEFNHSKYVYFTYYNSDENMVYDFNLEIWSKKKKKLHHGRFHQSTPGFCGISNCLTLAGSLSDLQKTDFWNLSLSIKSSMTFAVAASNVQCTCDIVKQLDHDGLFCDSLCCISDSCSGVQIDSGVCSLSCLSI
jgi:hypothetical protein